MRDWIAALARRSAEDGTAVLVTVVAAKGSVPRGAGTRMVVAADAIEGTIGGGHLEYKAIEIARGLMAAETAPALHRFALGASLGQCCGGVAQLLFEPVHGAVPWIDALDGFRAEGTPCAVVTAVRGDATDERLLVTPTATSGTLRSADLDREAIAIARAMLREGEAPRLVRLGGEAQIECFVDVVRSPDFHVVLFGAGHVGRAVVRALGGLGCRITWIDARDDAFPAEAADGVLRVVSDAPEGEVAAAPPGAYFLVMTHSHAQDEAIAERILARGDFAYFGLIGSVAKRRQFEKRMEARGMPRSRFAGMTCPIGIAGITGKEPAVIAIAVAAELLQVRSRVAAAGRADRTRCA